MLYLSAMVLPQVQHLSPHLVGALASWNRSVMLVSMSAAPRWSGHEACECCVKWQTSSCAWACRVMLIDNEKHTEKLVVEAITTVVGVDDLHAKNCFQTSKQLGQALITSCLKEHAEFYAEQIQRKGVSATIEPDSTTL